ncbi:MAG: tetratricopeptide repeat protein, partial [Sphingobacteriales bacterium]
MTHEKHKLMMAKLELQVGDYATAQESAIEALPYFEEKDTLYLTETHNTIGMSYEYLHDYKKAALSYKKAIAIPNTKLNHIILQNNLAHIYTLEKRYDKALPLYRKLLSYKVLQNSTIDYARVKDNYGYALFQRNQGDGEALLLESTAMREKDTLLMDLPASYLHLSEFYIKKEKDKAMHYANLAYSMAATVGNPDEKLEALSSKIKIKVQENDSTPLQYVKLDDSLTQTRRIAKNEFAELRYSTTELKLNNAKNQVIILVVIIIFIIFLIAAIFIWYKTKKNRQLTEQRTTSRIAKKLHDEVANDMFHTMAFAEHEDLSQPNIKDILLNNLEDIYGRTRDIS